MTQGIRFYLARAFFLFLIILVLNVISLAPSTSFAQNDNWTTYQDTEPFIEYRHGTWDSVNIAPADGGNLTYTLTPMATVEIEFFGTGIEVVYASGPEGGDFDGQLFDLSFDEIEYHQGNGVSATYTYGQRLSYLNLPEAHYILVLTNQTGALWLEAVNIQGNIEVPSIDFPSPSDPPPPTLLFQEDFDGFSLPEWMQGTDWQISLSATSFAAETRQEASIALMDNPIENATLELAFEMSYAQLELYFRESSAGRYALIFHASSGQLSLLQDEEILESVTVSPTTTFEQHNLQLTINDNLVTVGLDGVTHIERELASALPAGTITLHSSFPAPNAQSVLRLDAISVWGDDVPPSESETLVPEVSSFAMPESSASMLQVIDDTMPAGFNNTIFYAQWLGPSPREQLQAKSLDNDFLQTLVARDTSLEAYVSLSPRGDKIAFASTRNPGGNNDSLMNIFVIDLTIPGILNTLPIPDYYWQQITPFSVAGQNAIHPTWSPDGKHLAFAANHTGIWKIFVYHFEQPSPPIRLTNSGTGIIEYDPDWSNTNRIAFSSNNCNATDYDIFVANPTTPGYAINCAVDHRIDGAGDDFSAAWSPDGRFIAYAAHRNDGITGVRDIFLHHVNGQFLRLITSTSQGNQVLQQGSEVNLTQQIGVSAGNRNDYGNIPSWSPTGNALGFAYISLGGRAFGVINLNLSSNNNILMQNPNWRNTSIYPTATPYGDMYEWSPVCRGTIILTDPNNPAQTANIRSGPGTGYSVLGTLPEFTVVGVIGEKTNSANQRWYNIIADLGTGSTNLGWTIDYLVETECTLSGIPDVDLPPGGGGIIILPPPPPPPLPPPIVIDPDDPPVSPGNRNNVHPIVRDFHVGPPWDPDHPAYSDAVALGLPMPFDILPVISDQLTFMYGYGPNDFTWQRSDYSVWTTYRDTHGYHTGLDFLNGGETDIEVVAVCDGVIGRPRTSGSNGGSTRINTGRGLVLHCFQDDPALIDPDQDGFRNISNLIVTYNHIYNHPDAANHPFPEVGDLIKKGEILAVSTHYYACSSALGCNITDYGRSCSIGNDACPAHTKQSSHLHLEMFIGRGFRDNSDAVRINPSVMFIQSIITIQETEQAPYYPRFFTNSYSGETGTRENLPYDFNDSDDLDFGIAEGQLHVFTPIGDLTRPEHGGSTNYRGLFWTRENTNPEPDIAGVQQLNANGVPEWTASTLRTTDNLSDHMYNDSTYLRDNLYLGASPHCTNVSVNMGTNPSGTSLFSKPLLATSESDSTENLDKLCGDTGQIENNDSDLDIPG